VIDVLGLAGIAVSMFAYIPQVIHLVREHCSEGVSTRAWTMWLVGALLVGIVAVERRDAVFIVLQFSTCASAALILFLTHRYRGSQCASHARPRAIETIRALVTETGPQAEAV
jgi:uncharacterized protein with PQ loop repeat